VLATMKRHLSSWCVLCNTLLVNMILVRTVQSSRLAL